MITVYSAHRLYTPLEEIQYPLLEVEEGRITKISSRAGNELPANAIIVDFGEAVLVPGFIDLHMHGGAGVDVMLASQYDLSHLGKFLTIHGVTGYFPTTVGAPLDATCVALERLAGGIEAAASSAGDGLPQARPLGIHLE